MIIAEENLRVIQISLTEDECEKVLRPLDALLSEHSGFLDIGFLVEFYNELSEAVGEN